MKNKQNSIFKHLLVSISLFVIFLMLLTLERFENIIGNLLFPIFFILILQISAFFSKKIRNWYFHPILFFKRQSFFVKLIILNILSIFLVASCSMIISDFYSCDFFVIGCQTKIESLFMWANMLMGFLSIVLFIILSVLIAVYIPYFIYNRYFKK